MDESVYQVRIEQEMRSSFLDYAMSVIVARALPDVRDGLKPVHRRILYAMYQLKNFHDRPYLKSARIVGDVIGRFHPHGDSPVYEALVRMAQNFSLRYPIVEGQGNFGSIDGDPPAAMRYTESRMQSISALLLEDIERETVDFVPNYDGKEQEPVVLPARLPQLLVNGTSGIAVGMATNIPPHNITEIINGLYAVIDDPCISTGDLMQHVQAPDFPTRGILYRSEGLYKAYDMGKGSITVRGRAEIEELKQRSQIVITEIPFQVNKAKLLEKMADLVRDKKIDSISDLRDESAQDEMRIVVELKRGELPDVVLNNLYKMTPLQSSFGVNMVALVDGVPRQLGLRQMLLEFYRHRQEVVTRRTLYLLRRAKERLHLLEGLKIATENIDAVVELVKKARDFQEAQRGLIAKFKLSLLQSKAILDMRLARLTGLERDKIISEYEETQEKIKDYEEILAHPQRLIQIIKDELQEILDKFGDERRTEVQTSASEITIESLVADEEVVLTVTIGGYVKRTPLVQVQSQRRGGKGKRGMLIKEEDVVKEVFRTTNHCYLLCFSNTGRVYSLRVYDLPEGNLRSKGRHFANLIGLRTGESIVSVLPVQEFSDNAYIVSCTERGIVKKTKMSSYSRVRANGIIGLKLAPNDALVRCARVGEGEHILIASRAGKSIRFDQSKISVTHRNTQGVIGMRLSAGDQVIGMEIVRSGGEGTLFSICENGFGKRTPLDQYRIQDRAGSGVFTIKVTKRNGYVVGVALVNDDDDMMSITSSGVITRFNVKDVGIIGRVTQGVKIMNIDADAGEKIVGFTRVPVVDAGDADPAVETDDKGDKEQG